MRRSLSLIALLTTVTLAACAAPDATDSTQTDAPTTSALWVLNADTAMLSGTIDELVLELRNVDPLMLQFADRPTRAASSIDTADFVDRWTGEFSDIAPNVAVSYADQADGTRGSVVATIQDPVYDEDARTLRFAAELIVTEDARVPASMRDVSVFVDDGEGCAWGSLTCMTPAELGPGWGSPQAAAPSQPPAEAGGTPADASSLPTFSGQGFGGPGNTGQSNSGVLMSNCYIGFTISCP